MANNESRRPHNWFYNHVSGRWELRGNLQGSPLMSVGEDGFNAFARTGTLANINVGTLAVARAVAVAGQGSIANLNTTTGTITNLNVGSTLDINRLIIGDVGVGGAAALSYLQAMVGTIALTAIGTGAVAVATVSGVGSSRIAVMDKIFVLPRAALSGVALGGVHIPTTNVINVYVVNPSSVGGGSLPAVGLDILHFRT